MVLGHEQQQQQKTTHIICSNLMQMVSNSQASHYSHLKPLRWLFLVVVVAVLVVAVLVWVLHF